MSLLHYLMQQTVRHRVLRYFHRHGLLERHVTEDMLTWQVSGGFSIDASVRIAARDHAGLERLLRFCNSSLGPEHPNAITVGQDYQELQAMMKSEERSGE